MARRQEVFQSKVLQKLYPAASKREEEPSPPCIVETLAQKLCPKRNISRGDGGAAESAAAHLGRRVYTALAPPADYETPLPPPPPPHPEEINRSGDPAESSEEPDPEDGEEEEEEEGHGRRRRKRRRKPTQQGEHLEDAGEAAASERTSDTQGGERLSRNKRRKLKKKRHKQKLLASGLVPRATALEFTYQREGGEEEEEEEKEEKRERRAAEVTDFLRTTMETYMSDGRPALMPGAVEDLLSRMSSGRAPPSVLGQIHHLKALVQQKEPDRLAEALEELNGSSSSSSSLSPEETSAVVGLFQYWITDILPMQTHRQTGPSMKHTEDPPPHQTD